MATTRTTITLTGSIQQVIYRQAWQNTNRRLLALFIFPATPVSGVTFPQLCYQVWLARGASLTSTTNFASASGTKFQTGWGPNLTVSAPLQSVASLDYSDVVFVRGFGPMLNRSVNFDYVDTAP